MDIEKELQILKESELQNKSFEFIKNNSDVLFISFASLDTNHTGFERKRSLLKLSKETPIDILYLRDRKNWYIGGIDGIGNTIEDTIDFIGNIAKNYRKVITIGGSQGGFASILFASIHNFFASVAIIPQTDLHYCHNHRPKGRNWRYLSKLESWKKYGNLKYLINDKTLYFVHQSKKWLKPKLGKWEKLNVIEHGMYHYENIQDFKNVKYIDNDDNIDHGTLSLQIINSNNILS